MIEKDKLYSIWVYLQAEPLFWLTLTIGSYLIGDYLYKRSKLFPLVNPVAISIFIVSLVLISFLFHLISSRVITLIPFLAVSVSRIFFSWVNASTVGLISYIFGFSFYFDLLNFLEI